VERTIRTSNWPTLPWRRLPWWPATSACSGLGRSSWPGSSSCRWLPVSYSSHKIICISLICLLAPTGCHRSQRALLCSAAAMVHVADKCLCSGFGMPGAAPAGYGAPSPYGPPPGAPAPGLVISSSVRGRLCSNLRVQLGCTDTAGIAVSAAFTARHCPLNTACTQLCTPAWTCSAHRAVTVSSFCPCKKSDPKPITATVRHQVLHHRLEEDIQASIIRLPLLLPPHPASSRPLVSSLPADRWQLTQ